MDSVMQQNIRPLLGFIQPGTGSKSAIAYGGMGRRSKKDKLIRPIIGTVAQNITILRDRVYGDMPHTTARNKALAKDADTTLSQIQRICEGNVALGIDMLEAIAIALKVRPQDLLTPYFASAPDAEERTPLVKEPDAAHLRRR